MLSDLKMLATFGKCGPGVDRRAMSAADLQARHWLVERMQEAKLAATIDGVGNVLGRTPGVQSAILLGSHADTVPRGGWLDGAYGTVCALEIARAYGAASPQAAVGVDAICFSDEEGRFASLLGSKVFCGEISAAMLGEFKAQEGLSLRAALGEAGLTERPLEQLGTPQRYIAFLEAHIEQGPVLEQASRCIGIVTAIVGVRRCRVCFRGEAAHAGTTPMGQRRDAARAMHRFAIAFDDSCRSLHAEGLVWNLGDSRIVAGAYGVVAREAEILVEFRAPEEALLEHVAAAVERCAVEAATSTTTRVEISSVLSVPPAPMHQTLVHHVTSAASQLGLTWMKLQSGAGHDAMVLSRHLPTAMLFIPSKGGQSHHVNEDSSEADLVAGLRVLARAVEILIERGIAQHDAVSVADAIDGNSASFAPEPV